MTFLYNDPQDFTDELIDGFVAAYSDRVVRVPGGVIRATAVDRDQVAVVIGGGSGHYPAFAGLVGPGLAHGAAIGNVFASPSAQQVYDIAKAVHAGGGVLLTYGNYAGDVLNFDEAERRLNAEGIWCRTVTVTDDISSASRADKHRRRGIAGDLCVFKAAAYLAEQGADLDEVYEFTRFANERTRSFGLAFSGCTLPGAKAQLFEVPAGQMGVGMGIHGEPGLREAALGTANEVAEILVDGLLAELPEGIDSAAGQQVAVLTNGLGSVKYEELFVLHRRIDHLLRAAGVQLCEPDVGEMCTSFDMAGVSLTLCWLDANLRQAWCAPADTPAYRKGWAHPHKVARRETLVAASDSSSAPQVPAVTGGTDPSAALAALDAIAATLAEHAADLGDLDAIAGDGDHGIGMQRGSTAACDAGRLAAADGAGIGATLVRAGQGWADKAGGTSGAIWGCILRTVGNSLGDRHLPSAPEMAEAVRQARDAVIDYGKAQVGDKTLVDALDAFAVAIGEAVESGCSLPAAWATAAERSRKAAEATANMLPRVGRARPHGEKSLGTPDPGAVSMALAVEAVAGVLADFGVNE